MKVTLELGGMNFEEFARLVTGLSQWNPVVRRNSEEPFAKLSHDGCDGEHNTKLVLATTYDGGHPVPASVLIHLVNLVDLFPQVEVKKVED